MALFELFGKKPAPNLVVPFDLTFTFHPLRIAAFKPDYIELVLTLRNTSREEQLTSFIITVPHGLGFEQTGLSQEKELRMGFLKAGEEKKFKINIYGNTRTRPGDYTVKMYAAAHYRNYGYVQNELRKTFSLRVV